MEQRRHRLPQQDRVTLLLRIILIGCGIFLIGGGVWFAGKGYKPIPADQRKWTDLPMMMVYLTCALAGMGLGLWLCIIGLSRQLEVGP